MHLDASFSPRKSVLYGGVDLMGLAGMGEGTAAVGQTA